MRETSVTMRDIAERVGKSVSAVSRALAGSPQIGPETATAVRQAAQDLGYVPNAAALQLKRQRTDTVGLVLPAMTDLRYTDPSFSDFLAGLASQLGDHGLQLLLSTDTGTDAAAAYVNQIRSRRVDGFVIVRTRLEDPRTEALAKLGVPFVTLGRTAASGHAYVDEDGAAAMADVVDHLVELGHERFVCLAEPMEYSRARHRVDGFLRRATEHGLRVTEDALVVAGYRQESGHAAAGRVLDGPTPPTAIVCCNDLLAIGAQQAAVERGLEVGRELSITGYDDIMLAGSAHPPLTTVHSSAHEAGAAAANILAAEIKGHNDIERQLLLTPRLVVRGSTGRPQSTRQEQEKSTRHSGPRGS